LIRSGIAGINIVSAYITIVAMQLSIASTFHAEAGIFTELEEEVYRLYLSSLVLFVFLCDDGFILTTS
jgi:hypothetical protein